MKCIICNTDRNCVIFLNECSRHPTYWKCEKCGLVFAYPQRICNYNTGSNHEDYYLSDNPLRSRIANYAYRFNVFQDYLPDRSSRLLDIGASNGVFLHFLQSKGINGIGIEPDVHASEYGRNEFKVEIITTTLEMIDDSQKYDIATMFNVLEHVYDMDTTLLKVNNILNAGGVFICEIPYIFTRLARIVGSRWYHYCNPHNWFLNMHTTALLLNKHGFKVDTMRFIPKIVTVSKIFDGMMYISGVYGQYRRKRRIQKAPVYSILNKMTVCINLHDHILIVAHKC